MGFNSGFKGLKIEVRIEQMSDSTATAHIWFRHGVASLFLFL